jgi:aminomethyltransferase
MLMPKSYGNPEEEYWRLIKGVAQWDVSVQRQVELIGPDAHLLAQALTTRDVSKCKIGQGKYTPICNHLGILLNDPIFLKLANDRFWFSIADSNIWFWAQAIAAERGLDVLVNEPNVSPMAVQGPKAEDVVANLFGDWVRDLNYFWFRETTVSNIKVILQRSGWSKQGGYEIYLMEPEKGEKLWNLVKEAGKPFEIGPGNPNTVERIESGLLSFGDDTDSKTNPFEVRLGKYVDFTNSINSIGIQALIEIKSTGISRHQLGVTFDHKMPLESSLFWHPIFFEGKRIGDLTNCIWSYRLKKNLGFALVSYSSVVGDRVSVNLDGNIAEGSLVNLPFC